MHEQLGSFKQNPSQKFCKNLINFEKSQKFSKTPKLGQKIWNAWLMSEKASYGEEKWS